MLHSRPSVKARPLAKSLAKLSSVAAVFSALAASTGSAQTNTWTAGSGTDFLWDTATNWSLTLEPLATDSVVFGPTIPNPASLANPSIITLTAGELGNSLSFLNSFTFNGGDLTLTTGNISVSPTFTATINSLLGGTAGLTKSGNGTLVLGGANTLTGSVSVTAGTLRIGLANALGANDVTVGAGAILDTNLNAPTLTNGIILSGGTYRYGGIGTNAITGTKAINLTADGTIDLLNAGTAGKLLLGANQLTSAAGTTLTKTGAGVLQLSGANAGFQSDVVMNGGLIEFQNADSLGTTARTITVNSGAEFVASGIQARHNFTLNTGAIISANGAGAGDFSGTLTLNGAVNVAPRLFQSPTVANSLKISGNLAGAGSLNVNGVSPSLQANGTATGFSTVYLTANSGAFTGNFNVNGNGRLAVSPTATSDPLAAQTVNFAGGTLSIAPDVSAGPLATAGFFGRYYNNTQLASALIGGFDFGLSTPTATRTDATINSTDLTAAGVLPAGVATTNLGISWAAVLKVNTAGTYSFNTNSDDGSMMYVDGVPIAVNDASQGLTTRGGSIALTAGTHSVVIKYAQGAGGAGMVANYAGPDTGGGTVVLGSVAGTITNNGTGILGSATIDNPLALATGQVGTLEAVGGNVTSTGTLNIGNAGTFGVAGQTGAELVTQAGAVTLNGRATINAGGTGQSFQFAPAGADLTISGDIGEAVVGSSLFKTGGRTLTLTGAYNWTGSTVLAGGFLNLNKPLPGAALTIINNGLNNANATGVIGSGTFTVPATVNVYGASTGTNTFSGNIDLGGGARTFNVWGQGNTLLGGTLSNGSVVKSGLGSLTANTANAAFTGQFTVNSGRLGVTNVSGLGAATTGTVVNSGGYLDVVNVSIAEPLTLNGDGQPIAATIGAPGAMRTGALQGSGGLAGAVTGPITLGSNASIGVVKGSALTISGVISDGGSAFSLTKMQGDGTIGATPATLGAGGTLVLTGANTYTGATIIQAGELRLANSTGAAIASTSVRIGNGSNDATLTLGANDQMPASVVLDFGNANRNSKFQLNGFNQTVAGFANTNLALPIIQNFETAGAGTSTLTVNNPANTTFSGLIRNQTGTLALIKAGAGTLTLSGNGMFGTANIGYTGATSITAGKLVFQDSTSTITTPITISGTGSLEFNEAFGRTTVYQAALTDNGLGFTKTGKGNLTVNTVGAVTGPISVAEGTLNLTDATGNVNPLPGAPINVAAGAQVQFYGVTAVTTSFNNNITLNGLTLGGALSGAVVGGTPTNAFTGTLTLAATSNISTGWSDKTMNWTGQITGPGGLVIDKLFFTQNPPIVNITNTGNNYAGGTTLNSGTVTFTSGALPSGNLKFGGTFGNGGNVGVGQYVLNSTAGLSFTRALGTGANQVQFTGDGGGFSAIGGAATVNFGGAGAVLDWQGAGTTGMDANASLVMNTGTGANNAITVANDFNLNSGVRRIVTNTNTVTYSGSFSGSSTLVIDGAGTTQFTGSVGNTYTGLTDVIGGTLNLNKTSGVALAGDVHISSNVGGNRRVVYLNNDEQIADTASVSFVGSNANNGDLRLLGFDETVAGIFDRSGGGVIETVEAETATNTLTNQNAAGSILTITGANDSFYNGFMRNRGSGTYAGTLSLVKGGTGTLTLSAGQQSGNGSLIYSGATTINGGTLVFSNIGTYSSPVTVGAGAVVGFNANINQNLTENQLISGAGDLVKSGPGTIILSAANAYSGNTVVNGGTLTITGSTAAGQTGGYTVNANSILLIGNGSTAGVLTNNNPITVNAGGTAAFSRNNGYNYSGIISGAGNVESRAGGTATILSGANTYSGSTRLLAGSTLALAGSGASAGGVEVNSGATLTLDFNLAGSNPAGIVASSAPVKLNGGTLTIAGSGTVNTQSLGPVVFGTALPDGLPGLTPTQPGAGNSAINLTSSTGTLNVNLGPISHAIGGSGNIALPALGTVKTTGSAIGGIANGYTTTNAGTTWLAQDGAGVLTPLATYGLDTFGAGVNTDVTVSGSGASTNSLRFNAAVPAILTLSGLNTIASGGILVTGNVGGNASSITGGSLAGNATDGLTVLQNNGAAGLTIGSTIVDNGGATGLTKAGAGALTLSAANTYSGGTFVSQGTLILAGSATAGTGLTSVAPGGTLQIGDGISNGVVPTRLLNAGTFVLNSSTAQALATAFNASSTFNSVSNAIANGSTFQTGSFQKLGAGTLTITNAVATNTFHLRAGTAILDTGANVFASGFSSIGLSNGDNAVLTMKGAGRFTVAGDLNVSDVSASRGTLNIQDQAVVTAGNLFVGKSGVSVGVVNQTFGSVVNSGGSNDWRIGGNGTAGSDTGAYGNYNLSAGSFQTGRNFQIGASGIGIFNQTGGTVSVTGGTPSIGRFASGGLGELNISNGTFTHNTTTNIVSGENGVGVINVSGFGQLLMTNVGTANIGLALGGANANGTVNLLSGGLIQVGQVRDFDASIATPSTFNFNGGTLRVTTATANAATFMTGLTNAFVQAGGANIDTNGVATTIAQALVTPTGQSVTSVAVGAGGSGYVGEPIVTLTGGSGSGATARAIVAGGVITGYTITNPGTGYTAGDVLSVNVLGGGGTGGTGTVTLGAAVTTGGLTKLNTGALTLTGTSTYGGATTIAGGSIVESFTGTAQTNLLPANALNLSGGSLTLTGFAAGNNSQAFSSTAITGVGVVVSNIGTGGTMAGALGAITRSAGGAVDFSGTGTITTPTANTGGTILGGWATQGAGANWAVSAGDGTVAGNITALAAASYTANTWAAGINTDMTTAGTVTNLATNSVRFNSATPVTVTISGTDTINTGGVLITPTATAAATIFTGGTLATGTNQDLIVNHFGTNTATIASVVAANGTGGLIKSGGGTLILSGANSYSGDTTIGAGTLRLGVVGGIPSGTGKGNVILNAGATLDLNQLSPTINGLSGYGTVTVQTAPAASTTYTLTEGTNNVTSTFSGVINNNGNAVVALTKTGTGTLTLNNIAAGTYTGATTISAGAIKIATPAALSNNTVVVVNTANGLLFDTTVPTISALGGNSTFALQTTGASPLPVQLSVGNNNNGNTYSGALTGSGTLVKIGTGTQTLSGTNTNAGGFVASGGNLFLTGNNQAVGGSLFINSGNVVVANPNALVGASGRNQVIANGGVLTLGSVTANPASVAFPSVSSVFSRVDQGSSGVLALTTDASLQTPITENLDFAAAGLNVSLGAGINATGGLGTAPVQYTGIITPSNSTFRVGGGNGRLILPNAATLAGANNLILGGGNGATGQLFLPASYGFTGSTLVNSGTNIVTNIANGGLASSLGAGSAAASNLVLNGGTLQYVGPGGSTDRLFTLSTTPSALDASGAGALNFASTGAVEFRNAGNRTLTLQGSNTGLNTIAAAIGDSVNIAGTSGTLGNGVTTLIKNGNGTWILAGNNTFSGGVTINNGVLQFNSAAAIGGAWVNGQASVLVNSAGAVALGGSLTSGIQATLNRISPLSAGTVALTANSAENLNFDGGAAGAQLAQAYLGAYGDVTYTGTLTPFASAYRLGGGGGILRMPSGGLTGPRPVLIGGGGPGAGFVNNPNLQGLVVLGGSSDYSGGTTLQTGAMLSATSVAALGTGPLRFEGGFYRAIDDTDISLASDGTTAREIRIGAAASNSAVSANIDVAGGVNLTLSKTFGMAVTLGSNQGQASMTKYGEGTLVLANGLNLGNSTGTNSVATNAGTLVIERGALSILANPTNYVGNIQVGSNNGGVGTLKLGANNVFANTTAQFGAASVVDIYNGSKIDLNGFSDTIRNIRGMGSIANTGAGSPTLTTGTVSSENMLWGGNLVGNFVLKRTGNIAIQFGTGGNSNGIELWNNYNPAFTGKLVADGGGIRLRADGTLGSATEPLVADKITLNNGGVLFNTTGAVVLGANRGITVGGGGGMIWNFNSVPMVVNGPVSGPGMLTIADDAGTVMLGSDNNSWAGGLTINSNASGRGMVSIGAGGATGSLPAGDVYFNSAAGAARLYLFKSSALNLSNSINGPGFILQIGAGTSTLSGMNNTGQTTFVGGGKLRADFSSGNQPVGAGTPLQVGAGAFEYVAPAGDNTLRLGTLANATFGMPYAYVGGTIGDAVVQSTYGGSGVQNVVFTSLNPRSAGSTLSFVTSGGVNGVTNSIGFTGGLAANNAFGAAYYFNGSEFAAYDQNGFVRAVLPTDVNATADNTVVAGRYLRLTAAQSGQAGVSVPGINFSGAAAGFSLNAGQTLTLSGNPGALLKSGGGSATIGGGTGATVNNNGQELIVRTDLATDTLQIDVPIAGTGAFTKSGLGQLNLTAANTFTGTTLIDSGSVVLSGNGSLNLGTSTAEIRIANAAGQSASVTINSPTAVIATGNTANALRIGEGGNGTLTQSAGTVSAARYLSLGENQGSSGTYNMSGGTLNVKTDNTGNYQMIVGRAGAATMNISGSSVVNVLNGAQLQLAVGTSNPGGFQGMTPNAAISTGVGTVNQSGGSVNIATNNGTYQSNIFGGVVIGVDGTGAYNLTGGTLSTPMLGRGNGTASFTLGSAAPGTSGTLKATAGTMNVTLPISLTGSGSDKGTVDTNGNDVVFTGALTGTGGLKKAGAGQLSLLSKDNAFAGGTDISSGSVVASGTSLGTGVVNVGSGATLQVQGQQKGLLASFYLVTTTGLNPGVTTGSAAGMATEFSSQANFDAFTAGKAAVAIESTAARGKVSVNYLDLGGANQNSALPPAVIAINNGSNPFVARLDGVFNAGTTGDYTFQTRSDDGSVLFVDGIPVLDNNRGQGQTVRTGTIALTAGDHDLTVGYYQGTGGGGFSVGVTQPGQGQSFTIGSELNMSNDLVRHGSNNLTVGGLAGTGTVATVASGTLTANVASGSTDFGGTLTGSSTFVKSGAGRQILSGLNAATFTGDVVVTGGDLRVNGSLSATTDVVVSGLTAALSGSGSVGDVTVNSGGTLAPGQGAVTGDLATGSIALSLGSTLAFDLNGTAPNVGYDQLNVAGGVNLASATLSLSGTYKTTPAVTNDLFFLVINDGIDAISGTFAGLPQGSHVFAANGQDFLLTYTANAEASNFTGGNDIALQAVPEPATVTMLLGGLAMLAGARRRRNS